MKTGFIIKSLRSVQSMAQEEFASELDVTRAYLSQVENDKKEPSLNLMKQAAAALDIPLILLVTGYDNDLSGPQSKEVANELRSIFFYLLNVFNAACHGQRSTQD